MRFDFQNLENLLGYLGFGWCDDPGCQGHPTPWSLSWRTLSWRTPQLPLAQCCACDASPFQPNLQVLGAKFKETVGEVEKNRKAEVGKRGFISMLCCGCE